MTAVLVIGSGFAGLWAALGAARRCDELAIPAGSVDITVVSAKPFHDIRVRNYEADLTPCRIPLADLLDPVGVAHVATEVTGIDTDARTVATSNGVTYPYDRLVLASGSHVLKPAIPGLREHGFDVDTYAGALALRDHLRRLADGAPTAAAATVVVVGAGLTGIEVACELPERLRGLFAASGVTPRVVLLDRGRIGSDMGAAARPVIEEALSANGVEARGGVGVTAISERGVSLTSGEILAAATVVWCAGMRASSLTEQLPVARDGLGRVTVDDYLRVIGLPGVFAAGDVAAARMDDDHLSVMSCQHGRPMGRYAGYNVISDLFGEPLLALRIPWYVTVLDLGPAGALYTEGWDRAVVSVGARAKDTKRTINTRRIYPPLTGNRSDLLAAAAPELQSRP
ncbi:NADH dehydrogenase [Mycobacterium sp. ACS4054]|uniref:NAD(P)/FAD-dependent oxidoreductase n=1 Tax=Mycobacterium sp. ACS4054 TaxID=1834119 RepID=UPI0008020EF6|nr:FAD-dependent oxidoreductase [Mycobacterium sp. ACS4054]OBF02409.1 NADH dehydrogenase [Mycobacterium sp. ACS4054]